MDCQWGHPLEVSGQVAMSIPLLFYLKNQVSFFALTNFSSVSCI